MQEEPELTPSERFRITMELFELGVRLMRQNLVREYPAASEAVIDERLRAWLRWRPGAEHGDCPGRCVVWPLEL